MRQEGISNPNYRHGLSSTRLYKIFYGMKHRCYNTSNKHYKHYGGRGIKVCDEWLNDFTIFHDWAIANGYKDDLTIDRIDVNGDYEPSNCKWSTQEEQASNKRNSIRANEVSVARLAKDLGVVAPDVAAQRVSRGWNVSDAIKTPKKNPSEKSKCRIMITHNGEVHSIPDWSKLTGIKEATIRTRYFRGLCSSQILKVEVA